MAADQLWVRSHSYHDKFTIYRTQGQHFPIYSAPNLDERVEMSYRTIGKMFDWDLEKFRLGRKHSDKGNRRRLVKNISKFIKNPVGYVLWRFGDRLKHTRMLVIIFYVGFIIHFNSLVRDSRGNEKKQLWIQSMGGTPESSALASNEYRQTKIGVPMLPLYNLIYARANADQIVVNPTYRQNYRLYFDRMDYSE